MNFFSSVSQTDFQNPMAAQQLQILRGAQQHSLHQAHRMGTQSGEADLLNLLQQGTLNREEFISASGLQDQIQRLLAESQADGYISSDEHQHLTDLRTELRVYLSQYAAGDCRPFVSPEHTPNRQAGQLYDLVKEGKLSPQAVASMRELMAFNAASGGSLSGQVDFALEGLAGNPVVDAQKLGKQQFVTHVQLLTATPGLGVFPFPMLIF